MEKLRNITEIWLIFINSSGNRVKSIKKYLYLQNCNWIVNFLFC